MKKILLLLIFIIVFNFFIPVFADIIPLSSKNIKYYGIGVLNVSNNRKIYQFPDKNSDVINETDFKTTKKSAIVNSNEMVKMSYITYIPSVNIALLAVETSNDDGWYNVYINQKTGETGWIFNDNQEDFYTYKSLFYRFGKKYGIRIFNDISKDKKVLYSKQSENSQKLEDLSYPKYITFTIIAGNWILLTVNDMSKQAKVGWFKWRNEDGTLNMFPNFKEQI